MCCRLTTVTSKEDTENTQNVYPARKPISDGIKIVQPGKTDERLATPSTGVGTKNIVDGPRTCTKRYIFLAISAICMLALLCVIVETSYILIRERNER